MQSRVKENEKCEMKELPLYICEKVLESLNYFFKK